MAQTLSEDVYSVVSTEDLFGSEKQEPTEKGTIGITEFDKNGDPLGDKKPDEEPKEKEVKEEKNDKKPEEPNKDGNDGIDIGDVDGNEGESGSKVDETPAPSPEQKKGEASPFDYKSIVEELTTRGVIDDLKDVQFEVDGKEVAFSDLEIKTPEDFCNLIKSVIENEKEELLQNKIDTENVSDFTKALIEADKAGANIVELIERRESLMGGIENLDLSDKKNQLAVIKKYLTLVNMPDEEANEYYDTLAHKSDEEIETRARKYMDVIKQQEKASREKAISEAEERRKNDLENFKKFKKEIKTSFSEKYKLNEKQLTEVVDFVFKADTNGVTPLLARFKEMMNDPKTAPDVALFLKDPEEYTRQHAADAVKKQAVKTMKMITTATKTRGVSGMDAKGKEIKGIDIGEIQEIDI